MIRICRLALLLSLFLLPGVPLAAANSWKLIGWSDFGMNSMERDYALFAIYPPYVTVHAQLIDPTGALYRGASGVTLTYQGLADPSGSIGNTSIGKTNFWQSAHILFGGTPAPDTGITGNSMPGASNLPRPMTFETGLNRFTATGIPITPYDDSLNLNYYPLVRLTALDVSGNVLATARVTLPVSNEVECRACHASGADTDAQPAAGYANDSNPNRDFKLNILQLHDEKNLRNPAYVEALAILGYADSGLLPTTAGGTAVSCTACHSSNQFNTPGIGGIESLTSAMHLNHSTVIDPATGDLMNSGTDRATCYNCHPGTHTQSLRGPMGRSVGLGGSLQIQCQSCHDVMSAVGDPSRRGWIDLPNCQACHIGTAITTLPGELRLTDALDSTGALNRTTDSTFATTPDQPVSGASLFRYSTGHGGLQCSACHGSTHAELPSVQPNDDLQALDLTGNTGAIRDCTACHQSGISSTSGGPHGMHDVGAGWVNSHTRAVGRNASSCMPCHGEDSKGTALSTAFATRTLSTDFGTFQLFRGYIVSCYTCHNGPNGGEGGLQPAIPSVNSTSAFALSGLAINIPVAVTNGGVLRVVSQPSGGVAYVSGNTIVFRPDANFEGSTQITYAAQNPGGRDSNLGTAAVKVASAVRPFALAGVANAASYAPGIAPGMIAYIGGSDMGPASLAGYELNSGGFIEKLTAGTRVLFNGIPAALLYASEAQVSAIVPYEVAGQATVDMVVEYNRIPSVAASIPVSTSLPGIFTAGSSGKGQAAAMNQDGSVNSPSNPVARGSVVTLFLTGEGMTNPQPVDGVLAVAPYVVPSQPVTVAIGGQPASVQYAGGAPGEVAGMMQLNAVVPPGIAAGTAAVEISIGGIATAPVSIEVK